MRLETIRNKKWTEKGKAVKGTGKGWFNELTRKEQRKSAICPES